jgi:hypothetical protein
MDNNIDIGIWVFVSWNQLTSHFSFRAFDEVPGLNTKCYTHISEQITFVVKVNEPENEQ